MIIAVFGEKGGTGKTTLATNLAGMRAVANRDVLIINWLRVLDTTERS